MGGGGAAQENGAYNRPMRREWRRAVVPALVILITLYGALLRLDAFVGKYGALQHPGWARVLTHNVAPLGAALRPASIVWKPEARPYIGGDPINYLRFAREMRGFYDAHVREPVFLTLTRGWLWALDDQDAAVSFASLTGSTLMIVGTYLLGSIVLSPAAGLIAALLVAIEHELTTWGPDGWRDDTFTATVAFAAWALIRWYRRPTTNSALLAGGLCGVACLTRITALSFVIPGIVWFVAARPGNASSAEAPPTRRQRLNHAAIATGMCALVLGPYLLNCAVATGDPFYAINYHSNFYLHAEGRPSAEPSTAAAYVSTKFAAHPVATADTAFEGLFLQPFIEKWRGFSPWFPALADVLWWLSLIGLVGCVYFPAGRLLLVLLVTSLIPYMLTWNVGGGNEWRFTMPAYPFYLVAAACACVGAIRGAGRVRSHQYAVDRRQVIRFARGAGVVALIAVLGSGAYFGLPWFVAREAIAKGESTSIQAGRRDRIFYRDGWFPPHQDGLVVRFSREESVIRLPLPVGRDYDLVLRMDPVDPAVPLRVNVFFNGHLIGRPNLLWDPSRVGSYRVPVRADMVRRTNELTLKPEATVAARSAGERFSWLDPDERLGVRLWYVRVLPLAERRAEVRSTTVPTLGQTASHID